MTLTPKAKKRKAAASNQGQAGEDRSAASPDNGEGKEPSKVGHDGCCDDVLTREPSMAINFQLKSEGRVDAPSMDFEG